MEVLAKEKVKRREESDRLGKKKRKSVESPGKVAKTNKDINLSNSDNDSALASLVKSVKAKTQSMHSKRAKLK